MSNFQRPPPEPEGYGADAVWFRQMKKFFYRNWLRSVTGAGAKLIPDPSGGLHLVIPDQKPAGRTGAGGSWKWQTPNKEGDPTVAVAGPSGKIYTAVYFSALNPLCTTGLLDLVTGELTKAIPGWYQAARAVPAQVVNPAGMPAGTYYNVPCPLPQSVPTGTPLKGDADSATIFWIPMGGLLQCST